MKNQTAEEYFKAMQPPIEKCIQELGAKRWVLYWQTEDGKVHHHGRSNTEFTNRVCGYLLMVLRDGVQSLTDIAQRGFVLTQDQVGKSK